MKGLFMNRTGQTELREAGTVVKTIPDPDQRERLAKRLACKRAKKANQDFPIHRKIQEIKSSH
jgi:hypothetical protein